MRFLTFLTHQDVNAKVGARSKSQRWRDVRNDVFPAPAKDGARNNRWSSEEIDAFLKWRLELRDRVTHSKNGRNGGSASALVEEAA
jgi:predicted DNA-binding transcriptional regulator AlpA